MWEIFHRNQSWPRGSAILSESATTTWAELCSLSELAFEMLGHLRRSRVGVICDGSPESFAAMAALDRCQANAYLLDAGKTSAEIEELASTFQLNAIVRKAGNSLIVDPLVDSQTPAPPGVTILTSGTTGNPKAARHSWETLCRPVTTVTKSHEEHATPQRWLLTFRPQLYAGLQVTLHAFANAGTLVIPSPEFDITELVRFMESAAVGFVSATPSFWRNILLHVDPSDMARIPIRQITLGGELVDQRLLDQLTASFPNSRVTHIFATTELGKCFSVTDGREGFPITYLQSKLAGDVELRISDGRLFVRSANRMLEYDPLGSKMWSKSEPKGWTDTGDLVEIRGDRVIFVGRDTDLINVGGYKVNPHKVEQVLRELDEVADVRVFAQSSSITGQIVACDIVPAESRPRESVSQAVRERAMQQLDRYHRPRIINLVDEIRLSSAGKVQRIEPSGD